MLRAKLIIWIVKLIMGGAALGLGIWYVSSSIGGDSITYTSLPNFLSAIGVQNNDIASANGCFLCGYVEKLFHVIGIAAENFWYAILSNLWILMVIGFGIYLFYQTATYLYEASKKNAALDDSEKKLDFKNWFEPIWKQALRIMVAGAFLGAINFAGTGVLKTVSHITITPVMYVGSQLSMAASGVGSAAKCNINLEKSDTEDVLNPVMQPFMCTIGNLNTVMLAGAAGGFALMNYSWMDMGGGAFTWISGLALVIMFLIIGFNLFFQIFSVIFKLVFLIIFLPLIIAAAAFEKVWPLIKSVVSNAITMLVSSAVKIVAITLKIVIIYGSISFSADQYFPGPVDGYNAILPPILETEQKLDNQTLSVISVLSKCESVAMQSCQMDKEIFKNCFTASRAEVERKYPGAFDFMENGLEFLLLMIGMFLLYFWIISPKIDEVLSGPSTGDILSGKTSEEFDFGSWTKSLGKTIWSIPNKVTGIFTKGGK